MKNPQLIELLQSDAWVGSYTHASSTFAREGIAKRKAISCPSVVVGDEIVPYSGEFAWFDAHTFGFRHYTVSISEFPGTAHSWKNYAGQTKWNPDVGQKRLALFKTQLDEFRKSKYSAFDNPVKYARTLFEMQEAVRIEELRIEKWSDDIQQKLRNAKPDVFVLSNNLAHGTRREFLGAKVEHPFVVGEIPMKYVVGMFTTADISGTKDWIRQVADRDLYVGNTETLRLFEEQIRDTSVGREQRSITTAANESWFNPKKRELFRAEMLELASK